MTDEQKLQIGKLRAAGIGYKKIAEQMEISENTIKTYCRRHGLGGTATVNEAVTKSGKENCLCCGEALEQIPGRKKKKFCSDKCRNKWWYANLDKVNRKANYTFECPTCKKTFIAYGNSKRKYCSIKCSANRNRGVRE